ncbi:hypothetical protein D3C87_1804300 [compost metagenome]
MTPAFVGKQYHTLGFLLQGGHVLELLNRGQLRTCEPLALLGDINRHAFIRACIQGVQGLQAGNNRYLMLYGHAAE